MIRRNGFLSSLTAEKRVKKYDVFYSNLLTNLNLNSNRALKVLRNCFLYASVFQPFVFHGNLTGLFKYLAAPVSVKIGLETIDI